MRKFEQFCVVMSLGVSESGASCRWHNSRRDPPRNACRLCMPDAAHDAAISQCGICFGCGWDTLVLEYGGHVIQSESCGEGNMCEDGGGDDHEPGYEERGAAIHRIDCVVCERERERERVLRVGDSRGVVGMCWREGKKMEDMLRSGRLLYI